MECQAQVDREGLRYRPPIASAILTSATAARCSPAATMCAAAGWAATHPAIDSPASTPSAKRSVNGGQETRDSAGGMRI